MFLSVFQVMEKELYNKDYLTIFADDGLKLIHLQWKKLASSEEFREGLNFALAHVLKNNTELWLANLRNMSVIREMDREWTNQQWFPRIIKSKLRKMAIVNSLDYFNQSAVQKIMTKADPIIRFETQYFEDKNKAKEWLLTR